MRRASNLGLTLLLGGCTLWTPAGSPQQAVNEALQNQDYARASAIIDAIDESHPAYSQLHEQAAAIHRASDAHRDEVLEKARSKGKEEQWQTALTLLQENRNKVIEPAPLDALAETLGQRERHAFNTLLADRRLAQARALLASDQLDQQLARFHLDVARDEKRALEQQTWQLSLSLTALGDYFREQGQWLRARDLYRAAHRLTPDQPAPPGLKQAQNHLNSAAQQVRAERNRRSQHQAQTLMERYRQTGKLDDLLAARAFLRQQDDNASLATERKTLERWCRKRFADEMHAGEVLYTQGQYQQAHRIWQQVAPLYPDNPELNKKLQRSRRVLDNLENLEGTP